MPQISLAGIKYDDSKRIREDLNEESLNELRESIKNVGQITPIVVTHNGTLVAGRRRLEVAKRLGWTTIRAEYYEELSALDQRIVEFDENDKRLQLTWQERARAIQEIHALKREEATNDTKVAGRVWTANDTARTLGLPETTVREDLILASALGNARVAERPSRRGALGAIKRERELVLVRELARRRATELVPGDHTNTSLTGGVIYNEDCRAVLETMAPASVDLVVTDPPWGINLPTASQSSRDEIASYDDTPDHVRAMLVEVFPLLFRILKPACHLYCFFPIQEIRWWIEQLERAGFICRHRPLIWYKTGAHNVTNPYLAFRPSYESILFADKPSPEGARRIFTSPIDEAQGWPREPTLWHENSKPVEMLERWVEVSSEVNEVVLDPFSGGGSTLAATFSKGRYYIGCEMDTPNYTKSVERLKVLEARQEQSEETE